MNNTFTNIIVVVILVLIVAFGAWYFTAREAPVPEEPDAALELNFGGNEDTQNQ